ncbi:MAG: M55 family metallopeptidase, partial [Deltaproteobacteria bacterium]|nr:M55 family metallopeptidase [Deltaproteobacteria bacterium]
QVPVVLVTGDDKACSEAAGLLDGVRTVAVKEGLGSYTGLCLHPAECRRRIKDQARRALTGASSVKPFVLEGGVDLEVRFTTASGADQVKRLPGAERIDGTTVRFQGRDILEAFNAFHVMAELAGLTPFV